MAEILRKGIFFCNCPFQKINLVSLESEEQSKEDSNPKKMDANHEINKKCHPMAEILIKGNFL